MHRRLTPSLALALIAAGCGGPPDGQGSTAAPASGRLQPATTTEAAAYTPAERLDRLFAAHWDAWLELNPVRATFLGDHRWDDRWPVSISPDHARAERELLEEGDLPLHILESRIDAWLAEDTAT